MYTRSVGEAMFAPKGVPHTYRVDSDAGGRWLVVTTAGDFEALVRDIGSPAESDGLPPLSGPPSAEDQKALTEACAEHDIEIVGPPLH